MKRILCYGDSNTWGYAPKEGYRLDETTRWTGILQRQLPGVCIIEEGCNARTTLFDDPIEGYKNGREYLFPCLESQRPLDAVVLMLGSNDCKTRFALTASDIALGIKELAKIILTYGAGRNGQPPQLLLLCPPVLRYRREPDYAGSFDERSNQISRELPAKYARLSREIGCAYLDLNEVAVASEKDGLHLEPDQHAKVAAAVKQKLLQLLGGTSA